MLKLLKVLGRSAVDERGFTLMELLITVLIIGILAAVGAPLYFGYVRDAKLAEAKALAGSALTALQACAQANLTGVTCDRATLATKIGVDPTTGAASGGRWTLNTLESTLNMTGTNWTSGNANIVVVTGAGDVSGLSAIIQLNAGNFSTYCVSTANANAQPC